MRNRNVSEFVDSNCMDYSRYVIENRAIISIDGLKTIHRRIVWSMLQDKLTHDKSRTKSINASGSVLRYSPHGDSSVYGAMVRLANDSVLLPLIDGKGSFGTITSRDIQEGASRYTEMRLAPITQELYKDIKKNAVDMVENYDNSRLEPVYMPTTFPLVLANPNLGIAVGIASKFPSFNLKELCEQTIKLIETGTMEYLAPDLPTGGILLYDEEAIKTIHNTGRGGFILRSKYEVDEKKREIKVIEIPYTTNREAIIEKIIELCKIEKIKEISDVNDFSGVNGLEISIEYKKGVDPHKLMNKLFKLTTLQDTFSCNFNILIDNKPRLLGVEAILQEWLKFRRETLIRINRFDLNEKQSQLHLLYGLKGILLDIDKAIDIVKRSSNDEETISNLMVEFNIDKIQAEHVSEIKLKNFNKSYIMDKLEKIKILEGEISELKDIISDSNKIDSIIISQLKDVIKRYAIPRKTMIVNKSEVQDISKQELVEEYNCNVIITNEGWIKKCLKSSDNHKLKEGDAILDDIKSNNRDVLYLITNKANRYKLNCSDLEKKLPSQLGESISSLVQLEDDEKVIKVISVSKPVGYVICVYENGKIAKIDIKSYMSNNTKLVNCFNTDSKLIAIDYIEKDCDVLFIAEDSKALIVDTSTINSKGSKSSQGNIGIKLNDGNKCIYSYINVPKDFKFAVETKTKEIDFMLDDVSLKNDDRTLYTYLKGRTGNKGNKLLQGSAVLNVINNK